MEQQVLNISPIIVWVIALSQLLTFGLTVYNLFAAGGRANAKNIEKHDEKLHLHDQRIAAVELAYRTVPNRKDFHDLEVTMTELKGGMAVLSEKLRPLESITDRMQDALMQRPKP
jgi:hypothetical protein